MPKASFAPTSTFIFGRLTAVFTLSPPGADTRQPRFRSPRTYSLPRSRLGWTPSVTQRVPGLHPTDPKGRRTEQAALVGSVRSRAPSRISCKATHSVSGRVTAPVRCKWNAEDPQRHGPRACFFMPKSPTCEAPVRAFLPEPSKLKTITLSHCEHIYS